MQNTESALSFYSEEGFRRDRAVWSVADRAERVILLRAPGGVVAWHCKSGLVAMIPHWHPDWEEQHGFVREFPQLKKYFPKTYFLVDGTRIRRGNVANAIRRTKGSSSCMIVPTTECHCACTYCYAKDGKKSTIDLDKIRQVLHRMSSLKSITVYGGESLLVDGLPGLLSDLYKQTRTRLSFVTGMGFPEVEFQSKVLDCLQKGISLCFSIDPPAPNGKNYGRVYRNSKGNEWFEEQIKRLTWFAAHGGIKTLRDKDKIYDHCFYTKDGIAQIALWGLRPTIGDNGYDFRLLRQRVSEATGVPKAIVSMNIGFETSEQPVDPTILHSLAGLLKEDVADIQNGALSLETSQYWKDQYKQLKLTSAWGMSGGCYGYWDRVSLGPTGQLSFCNECQTWEDGTPWFFGDEKGVDPVAYRKVMRAMYEGPDCCKNCEFRLLCGVTCPVNVAKGKSSGCMFARLKGMGMLRLFVNSMSFMELRRWVEEKIINTYSNINTEITDTELENRGRRLME